MDGGMENAIYAGLSRQIALQRQLEVTANNIANMNTPGFRAQHERFETFLAEPQSIGPQRGRALAMVIDQATVRDLRPGALEQTGNPLDLALHGDGYLAVETEAGTRYTRNGRLTLDPTGQLVDQSGLPVLGAGGAPITIPAGATDITISGSGEIATENGVVGRLQVVRFEDENALVAEGGGLFAADEAPQPSPGTRIVQGSFEQSNVQGVVEMTAMIDVSRQYQSTQNLLEAEHERLQTAIRRLGRKPQ
jgi:flagellar basal-body rod protein FlgF